MPTRIYPICPQSAHSTAFCGQSCVERTPRAPPEMNGSSEPDSAPWKEAIIDEWRKRRSKEQAAAKMHFPLISNTTGEAELIAMMDTLLSNQFTLGPRVKEFEAAFARWLGAPYACMVNSGSSANLLAIAAIVNPERNVCFVPGDEVLIPAVCWSTSLFPLMQFGLKPVFVDCDPRTMNVDLADMRRRITEKTKAVVLVHVLGNSCHMEACLDLCKEHSLVIVEDTCESLGSLVEVHGASPKYQGTLGDFGTYVRTRVPPRASFATHALALHGTKEKHCP